MNIWKPTAALIAWMTLGSGLAAAQHGESETEFPGATTDVTHTATIEPASFAPTVEPDPTPARPTAQKDEAKDKPKPAKNGPKPAFRKLNLLDVQRQAAIESKLAVVFFLGSSDSKSLRFENEALKDRDVLAWLAKNSVAIKLYEENPTVAKRGIARFPVIEIRASSKLLLDIIVGYQTPAELIRKLKNAKLSENAEEPPTGKAAKDPYSWLAHGFYLMGRGTKTEQISKALFWCLDNGEKHEPGFIQENLDQLLEKLTSLERFSDEIRPQLAMRQTNLHAKVVSGKATDFDAFTLARFGVWMRDMDDPIRAFKTIKPDDERSQSLQQVLMWNTLERLVAYRHYAAILKCVPDPKTALASRIQAMELAKNGKIAGLDPTMPRPPGATSGEEENSNLPDSVPLVPPMAKLPGVGFNEQDLSYDGALLFECLLAMGRTKDANALMVMTTDYIPRGRTYAFFIERANRLKNFDLAVEIAERGNARVPESELHAIAAMLKRGLRK